MNYEIIIREAMAEFPDEWFTGKATRFTEGGISFKQIDKDLQNRIKKLKVYDVKDLWGKKLDRDYSPNEDFIRKVPRYFILKKRNDYYLVNTEGYDYARYIVKLEDYK